MAGNWSKSSQMPLVCRQLHHSSMSHRQVLLSGFRSTILKLNRVWCLTCSWTTAGHPSPPRMLEREELTECHRSETLSLYRKKCDELTAKVIHREVSDGVVAPDYDAAALSLLAKKKNGNYCILKVNPSYVPTETEERTVFGLRLRQKRNNAKIDANTFSNVVGKHNNLKKQSRDDLIVSTIALKYAQSNTVCFAHRGQVIGIGAGQQSRIHCTRLAGEKACNWWLRQHPRVLALPWKATVRRAEKSNAIDVLCSGVLGREISLDQWQQCFTEPVSPLTPDERREWIEQLNDVVMSSDAFLPFRDNIDCAKQFGVQFVAHPGGSVRDDDIIDACNEYGITLIHTGLRLFHH
ncbi:hypothetical protein KIN20_034842 [Parelaphostrongylus tenuis]|uniref:Uncharacterized protein n=1 Tax=Parelaphostrongylus tenuis TaxID=148309 RepID=A0AAD5RAC3_PARTN|nr:hypothetical protein KIN20_034842 [Parelaphostrongylus tenuis]